jgi:hypothetical protein
MCADLLSDARLYALLLKFDEDLFARTREEPCPCGGVLHSACYCRKPRGAMVALPAGYDRRHSLCCAADGCRKRRLPPSLRYLGRKVYLGAVVVIVTAMRHGVTAARGAALAATIGVSRRTLARWRRWWTEAFPATAFWQRARGRLHAPVAEAELPSSLLARIVAPDERSRLARFLDFIKPLTTAATGNWESISMVDLRPQTSPGDCRVEIAYGIQTERE